MQSGVVQAPHHGDALVERLACNETRGPESHPVSLHETLQSIALGCTEDRGS
jgi:hypothetical protein